MITSQANEIEKEVQARLDFKMAELITGLKNRANAAWSTSFNANSPKHAHYWEAFNQLAAMIEKERTMPPPYDQMATKKKFEARDSAVDEISASLLKRGEYGYHHKLSIIARAIEKAQNF